MIFQVTGAVKGKPRPRFTKQGGFVRAYTPKDALDYERRIAQAYLDAGGTMREAPIHVDIRVYRKLPKGTPKKVARELDIKKPDIDNIAKSVLDALNGVAYQDDAQVVDLRIAKMPREHRDEDYMVIEIY